MADPKEEERAQTGASPCDTPNKSSCCSGEEKKEAKKSEEKKSDPCSEETWQEHLKRVMFAGIGAVAIAQGEMEYMIKKLIEKGAIAEKEGRKWIKEVIGKHYRQTKERVQSIEHTLDVEGLIKKFSLPTKAQVEKLSQEVEHLSKKVEELCQKIK